VKGPTAERAGRAGVVLLLALALGHHGPVFAVFLAGAATTLAWAARCERAAGRPLW